MLLIKKEIIRGIAGILAALMGFLGMSTTPVVTDPYPEENQIVEVEQEVEQPENKDIAIQDVIVPQVYYEWVVKKYKLEEKPVREEENSEVEVIPEDTETIPENTTPELPDEPVKTPEKTEEPSVKPSVPSHTHNYVKKVITPTCTQKGYTTYSCACGENYTDNYVDQTGHTYKSNVIAPTTEAGGYTAHVCSVCGDSYNDNYTDKLPAFKTVEETVYAVSDVNIRKGPGTQYEKVGLLSGGNHLTRVGVGDNGWSKVIYNGKEAYISSNYLTTTKPVPPFDGSTHSDDILAQINNSSTMMGVLYINAAGMTPCPLYASRDGHDLQSIADRQNSAYVVAIRAADSFDVNKIELGDHNTHNFAANVNVTPGMVGYINMGDRVLKMVCASTERHESISHMDSNIYNDNGCIIITCCSGRTNCRTNTRWYVTGDSEVSYAEFYGMLANLYIGWR